MDNKEKDRLLKIYLAEYNAQRKIIAEAENARRKSFGFWVTIVVAISGFLASKILDNKDCYCYCYSFNGENFSISIDDETVMFIGCLSIMIITALFILRGVNCDFFIAKSAKYMNCEIRKNIIDGNIIPNEFSGKILRWEKVLVEEYFPRCRIYSGIFEGYYYLNETFLLFLIEIISGSFCIRYILREELYCLIALGVLIIIIAIGICIYVSFKACRSTINCKNESRHGKCCGKHLPLALLVIVIFIGLCIILL